MDEASYLQKKCHIAPSSTCTCILDDSCIYMYLYRFIRRREKKSYLIHKVKTNSTQAVKKMYSDNHCFSSCSQSPIPELFQCVPLTDTTHTQYIHIPAASWFIESVDPSHRLVPISTVVQFTPCFPPFQGSSIIPSVQKGQAGQQQAWQRFVQTYERVQKRGCLLLFLSDSGQCCVVG